MVKFLMFDGMIMLMSRIVDENFILIVEDNGLGILVDFVVMVIEEYVRFNRSEVGFGFGLVIVKCFVEIFGGMFEFVLWFGEGICVMVIVFIVGNVGLFVRLE